MVDRMTVYKDRGERTRVCADEAERTRALNDEDWWELPLWKTNPRPHGLSSDNPYERSVPYVYQEYPRTVHKPGGRTLTVQDDQQKAVALKGGWMLLPPMAREDEPVKA